MTGGNYFLFLRTGGGERTGKLPAVTDKEFPARRSYIIMFVFVIFPSIFVGNTFVVSGEARGPPTHSDTIE